MKKVQLLRPASQRWKFLLVYPMVEDAKDFDIGIVEGHALRLSFFVWCIECRREERRVEAYEVFVNVKNGKPILAS